MSPDTLPNNLSEINSIKTPKEKLSNIKTRLNNPRSGRVMRKERA
jgi:hypothetical protein